MEPLKPESVDPRLEALLDEALGLDTLPGGVPPHLAQVIYARTRPQLTPSRHRVVLARLEAIPGISALAAAIVLASGLGIALVSAGIVRSSHNMVVATNDLHTSVEELNRYGYPVVTVNLEDAPADDWHKLYERTQEALKALDRELLKMDIVAPAPQADPGDDDMHLF